MRISTRFLSAAALVALTASPVAHAAVGYTITASVDTEVCASVPVQCGVAGTGHTFAAAGDTNHNPIRLFVTVVRASGVPVNGLTINEFSFSNPFVPAGGGAAVICTEANCGTSRFGAGANGTYTIFLDRGPAGNWKAGAYAGTVRVVDAVNQGTAQVVFKIPDLP